MGTGRIKGDGEFCTAVLWSFDAPLLQNAFLSAF